MASRFWVGGTGTWDNSSTTHWSATSGGASGASVPGSGDTVTFDASSGGGTVTPNYDMTVTSITMGAFTGTLDFSANNNNPTMATFNCSGTGTRTLNMGSGTWTLTGNNTTIFTCNTTTNLVLNFNTSTVDCTYSGSTGTRTINLGSGASSTLGQLFKLKISAGTDIVNLTASGSVNINDDLDFTGFTGTLTFGTTQLYGNLILYTGMTVTSGTGVLTFKATSSKNITTNSVQFNHPITFDGIGGTWVLQDNLNMDGASARTLTLTNGTFDANNKNVTCGIVSSSNANTRTLTMGSGTWTLTGNAATIFNFATITGLTLTCSGTVDCTYAGSTGTRTLTGITSAVQINHLKISAGSDTVALSTMAVNDLDCTGFTGTFNSGTQTVRGNLTFGAGMTCQSGATTLTLAATSAKNITTNAVQFNRPLTLDGVGGSWTLKDNLDMGGASARTLTLTNGTLDAYDSGASHNVTCGAFSSSNSNTRSLDMGNGTWTLTGTGTVWNMATTTGLTFTVRTGTIKLTDASASAKTFSGGGLRYGNFWINGAGSGAYTIVGNNTFVDFKDDNSVAHTVNFTASSTQTVTTFTVSGSLGSVITLQSTSAGTAWNLVKTSGVVSSDYLSLQDSRASGGANFYAGANSTNVSGNSGWQFSAPNTNPGNGFFALFN